MEYTLEEQAQNILTGITENFPELKVQYGKYGDINIPTPGVLIYFEPSSAKSTQSTLYERIVNFHLFFSATKKTAQEAIFEATRNAEKVEKWISENYNIRYEDINTPFAFDSFYNDIAVVGYHFNMQYKSTVQP